jgi:hypothetical protein
MYLRTIVTCDERATEAKGPLRRDADLVREDHPRQPTLRNTEPGSDHQGDRTTTMAFCRLKAVIALIENAPGTKPR